jgi:hypothetical protein
MKIYRLIFLSIVCGVMSTNTFAQEHKSTELTKSKSTMVQQASKVRNNKFDPKAKVKVTPKENRKKTPTPSNKTGGVTVQKNS